MKAQVSGVGLYANGFASFQALRAVASDEHGAAVQTPTTGTGTGTGTGTAPRPALVPARELRRLPDAARLGVEVASQACAMASVDPAEVVPVFTSSMGDSAITDYMCRTLAGEQKLLSPLRFQNSVHNAPGGSLSIITGNRQPSSFVAAFEASFALALLEALVLCESQSAPVLLVCTDVPVPAPLSDVHGEGALAGAALLLQGGAPERAGLATLDGAVEAGAPVDPPRERSAPTPAPAMAPATLPATLPASLPATWQGWPLIEMLGRARSGRLALPVGAASLLRIAITVHPDQEPAPA